MSDQHPTPSEDPTNTRGVPGPEEEADVASGGAPERSDDPVSASTRDNDTDPDMSTSDEED